MNKETEQLIRELAEKLGTTTEHLWHVLVKQAQISAVINSVITVVMVVALWAFYRLVRTKTTRPRDSDGRRSLYAEWEDDGAVVAWLFLICFALIAAAHVYYTISMVPTALMNPEYWALKQLMP